MLSMRNYYLKLSDTAWNRTRTAKYFLNLYNRATLRGAVEIAAQRERERLLSGFHDYCRIPVDVESIAKRRGICFGPMNIKANNEDANIIPMDNGALLQLNPDRTDFRKRLTIAHEIGHTLFYRGKEHQIGVLDKKEMQAEETICFMFARALLMPPEHIRQFIKKIPDGTPWEILTELERARQEFKVSLPVLIIRIDEIKVRSSFPCLFLYLRYRENRYTKSDPQLRVDICSSIGDLNHLRTWTNRSAKGLNFQSAELLFNSWKNTLVSHREPTGGRYTLNSEGRITRAKPESIRWISEDINFSIMKNGRWRNELIPVHTASFLYVRKGWTEKQAYIISIIKRFD